MPTSKSRQELRSRFVRNAIPTEADFADLIAASLNQADDGVLKLPDQPLGLVRQKPDQPVLRFFADPAAQVGVVCGWGDGECGDWSHSFGHGYHSRKPAVEGGPACIFGKRDLLF